MEIRRAVPLRVLRFAGLLVLLMAGMQLMNRFLIFSGNHIGQFFQLTAAYEIFLIGVFQQLVQLTLAVVLARVFLGLNPAEMGFNTNNLKQSLRLFGVFCLVILTVILLYLWISYRFLPDVWLAMKTAPVPAGDEIAIKLFFQSIFPGLGEESLFRGFLISLLLMVFKPVSHRLSVKVLIAALSGFFFAAAHIYFDVMPFRLTHIDATQLALAFFCGIFYSFMFFKTRSLVGPILSHNFSNVSMSIAAYLVGGG